MAIKVQLIHPPHYNSLGDKLDVPLGLLVIASALREAIPAIQVVVNDLTGVARDDWNIGFADIYGITVYAPSLLEMREIAEECRARNPECTIVIGGAHPSSAPGLKDYQVVDHVVVGFGEDPMTRIALGLIAGNGDLPRVLRGEFGGFRFPAYDLMDLSQYCRPVGGERSIAIITSRGCAFCCAFCGLSQFHEMSKVRFIEADLFRDHLRRIKEMGIKSLCIQDDIFTLNRDRLFKILEIIKEFGFKFKCQGRAGYDTEEIYERLASIGCVLVAFGAESGSQYMLDRMNKRTTVQDNHNVIKWARKYGITSRAFFIIGFPGETEDTLEETKRFIMDADPDQYLLSNMVIYPGTAVWNDPEKFGVTNLQKDFSQYYQFGTDGTGPLLSFDTPWMDRHRFRELELELRGWLKKHKKFRNSQLDYEKRLHCA